jgi:cytoskeletal protein RodZ
MDLGAQFRVTREQLGLTLEDISARTKIPMQLLADFEMNDLARWPKHRVYQVGFLRAYAMEVGLNAEQVVALFVAARLEQRTEICVTKPKPTEPARGRFVLGAATVAICLSATLLVVFSHQVRPGDRTLSLPTPPAHATSDIRLEAGRTEDTPGAALRDVPADSEVEGELLIHSIPTNAWVVVNGLGRGRTPTRIQYLPVGSYTIRLLRDSYQSEEQRVTLTPDRPARTVRIILHELAP